jgi:hypothetical protein
MKNLRSVLAGVVLVQGCLIFEGGSAYPETDIVEPALFELKLATGIQKADGVMRSGTLEYVGAGDMVKAYREWAADMGYRGWIGGTDEMTNQKFTCLFRKEGRVCDVLWSSASGSVKVTMKIGPAAQ